MRTSCIHRSRRSQVSWVGRSHGKGYAWRRDLVAGATSQDTDHPTPGWRASGRNGRSFGGNDPAVADLASTSGWGGPTTTRPIGTMGGWTSTSGAAQPSESAGGPPATAGIKIDAWLREAADATIPPPGDDIRGREASGAPGGHPSRRREASGALQGSSSDRGDPGRGAPTGVSVDVEDDAKGKRRRGRARRSSAELFLERVSVIDFSLSSRYNHHQ